MLETLILNIVAGLLVLVLIQLWRLIFEKNQFQSGRILPIFKKTYSAPE